MTKLSKKADDGKNSGKMKGKPEEKPSPTLNSIEEIDHYTSQMQVGDRLRLENISNDIYHGTQGFGSTAIKSFIKCPKTFKAEQDGIIKHDPSKFVLGSATHDAILLFGEFIANYITMPADIKVRRGKAWDEFKEANKGKQILTIPEALAVLNMKEAVMKEQGKWFTDGCAEVSYWYKHESGLILKARSDYEIDDLVIDLKTTQDASIRGINNSMFKFGYVYQDALYRLVIGASEMVFVFVENHAPYNTTGPVICDDEVREYAEFKLHKAIADLAFCIEMDIWEGYHVGAYRLPLPKYLANELDEMKVNYE